MASLGVAPYHCGVFLADMADRGFVAPTARIVHYDFHMGRHVYVGDHVFACQMDGGGAVRLGDRVHIYGDAKIQTGHGGSLEIGEGTHVQPGCTFSAHVSDVRIGRRVEIAPNCAFYSYAHGTAADRPIVEQPLVSRGGVVVEDDAWLGHGVVLVDGARVGKGAVIGAGAVVRSEIPAMAIAVGVPARVVGYRK